jgi:hypothetical protein
LGYLGLCRPILTHLGDILGPRALQTKITVARPRHFGPFWDPFWDPKVDPFSVIFGVLVWTSFWTLMDSFWSHFGVHVRARIDSNSGPLF